MIGEFLKRHRVWLVALAVIGVVVALYTYWPPSYLGLPKNYSCQGGEISEPIAGNDDLTRHFDNTVFGPSRYRNTDNSNVFKWTRQLRIYLFDPPTGFERELANYTNTLSCLTGLYVYRLNSTSKIRQTVSFEISLPIELLDESLSKYLSGPGLIPNLPTFREELEKYGCFSYSVDFSNKAMKWHLVAGWIGIAPYLTRAKVRSCTIENLTVVLGFGGKQRVLEDAVIGGGKRDLQQLTINDKILIRTLYDKRIEPGMPRDEAMALAREIIPELIAAVKQRGVEALYQN